MQAHSSSLFIPLLLTSLRNRLVESINKISKSLEELSINVEHDLASIREKINNIVSKLEKREDNSEKRIENLEAVVKTEVEGTLTARLEMLEKAMKGNLDTKINTINRQIDMKIGSMESVAKKVEASAKLASGGGGWRLPFFLLLIILLGVASGAYWLYQKLLKSHIL